MYIFHDLLSAPYLLHHNKFISETYSFGKSTLES